MSESKDLGVKVEIPINLLPDLNEKEKYLFGCVSDLNRQFYLLDRRFSNMESSMDGQTKLLNEILNENKKTNGRLINAEKNIEKIHKEVKAFDVDIEKFRLFLKILKNKYFIILVAIFIFIGIPYLSPYGPEIIEKILRYL